MISSLKNCKIFELRHAVYPLFYLHLSTVFFFSGLVTQAPRVDGQHVTITYSNGDSCKGQVGKSYRTEITFICKTGLMVCELEA